MAATGDGDGDGLGDGDVWGLLAKVSRAAKSESERRLRAYGVHTGQHFVLECLWHEDGLTPSEIAERIDVEAATLTRALRRMEAGGLVRREPDAHDRRRIRTWLTERGWQVREPVTQAMTQLQRDALAQLSEHEAALLLDILTRMHHALAQPSVAED